MKTHKFNIVTWVAAMAISVLPLCLYAAEPADHTSAGSVETAADMSHAALYEKIGINDEIPYAAFEAAVTGYERITSRRKDILVLIDYTKPSTQERLYVIDMRNGKVLYKSLVAHGRGSGDNYAIRFSNTPDSHQSSLGFYLTLNTYEGKNGYSLRLDGLEPGINDKAYERAIVIHGADYCDRSFIKSAGRLGRSFGCPALPRDVSDAIIDTIKDGAVLFIYANDEEYMTQSAVLAPNNLAMN